MSFSSHPTTIPPSPNSPPHSGSKRRCRSDNLPQSPISPSFMSVATKSYVTSYENPHNPDEVRARSTPSSPRGSSSRLQQSRPTHSLPTPAHSITWTSSDFEVMEDTDQHRDKRPRLEQEIDQPEGEPIRPTNHNRNDEMEVDNERTVAEKTLDQVQEDMGDAFLLCRSKVVRQKPDPKQHLLALYALGPLLHSVARTDPRTGEKINKLRKSYEGQIKGFNLSGRNKPVKGDRNVEEDQPGPLRRMIGSSPWGLQPEDAWDAEHGKSKIEVTMDFQAKLKKAVQMQPGTVRNNAHWEDTLGFEKARPNPPPVQAQTAAPRPTTNGVRQLQPPSAEAKRQTRGKKRSYDDDSFVGYGEGFSDAEDGDEYGNSRKRKKLMGLEY